jgi:hypothetical protein
VRPRLTVGCMTIEAVSTEQAWRERVQAWRASGQTAVQFVEGRGFAAATLKWWSSRLGPSDHPAFVQLVAKPPTPRPAPELVVEVGGARVRVAAGFDPALLADVVRALGATR